MDISTIANTLKLPKKAYFLGSFISGILLFSGDSFLKQLSLLEFKQNYTLWIGVAFLLSIGMVSIAAGEFLITQYKEAKLKREVKAKKEMQRLNEEKEREEKTDNQKAKLKNLDNHEKVILREFYLNQKNTIEMSFEDPTVIGLINKGVIRQVGNQGYHSNITGGIAFFRADDLTVEFFGSFEFPELNSFSRPNWIEGLKTKEAINRHVADIGKTIQQL